jgi:hypothetical protein
MQCEDTDLSGSGPGYGIKPCRHGNPTPGFISNRLFNKPNDSIPSHSSETYVLEYVLNFAIRTCHLWQTLQYGTCVRYN